MATAVLLAAGHGTRMRSRLPKAMHPIAGRPMLGWLIAACAEVFDQIVVVAGPDTPAVTAASMPHTVVMQTERRGTAHAALCAAEAMGDGEVTVLYADNPLISAETLRRLRLARAEAEADLALLAMRPPEPGRYGRIVTENGLVNRIVEYADATEAERAIGLCNAGGFCADAADLLRWLRAVQPSAGGEYYLTDIVRASRRAVAVEAPWQEMRGVNSRAELAEAEAYAQGRLRAAAMDRGATLTAPETVFFSYDTQLSRDVTVAPFVTFGPGVRIAEGVEIRAFSHLEGCTVETGAIVGPYARLRPGTHLQAHSHVGNFVELKATILGEGSKANHLAYLGDSTIGRGTNIGAGTITCNYDGVRKHRTEIGDQVFVGSNATLVAPISLGHNSFVAAGSTLTEPVPENALAFGRARQDTKPGLATRLRQWLREKAT